MAVSVAEHPYLISQLMAMAQIRLALGLLRKVDGPAFGWEERLGNRAFYQGFLAAFQNDPWPAARDPEAAPMVETLTRIHRRFADGLVEKSPCEWTPEALSHSWDVAVSGEVPTDDASAAIGSESIIHTVRLWQRMLVDSELTALVLQARAEQAASRDGEWPARLANLESSVCPGHFYSYRRSGGVTLAFEGKAPVEDRQGLALPLTFRGVPPPTPTATPRPAATPTPSPKR